MSRLPKLFVGVLLLCMIPSSANSEPPLGGHVGTPSPSVAKQLQGLVAVKTSLSPERRKSDLVQSLRAIEDRGLMHDKEDCDKKHECSRWQEKHALIFKRCQKAKARCYKLADYWQRQRERIVVAAMKAEEATGVDAVFLLALGRMESDFRPLELVDARCGMPLPFGGRRSCGADCGITQHRIYGSETYVRRMCRKVAQDYNMSFLKSAQELAKHIAFCKENAGKSYHRPLRRCVLNRYNQGPFYRTASNCKFRLGCSKYRRMPDESKEQFYRRYKDCKRSYWRCRAIAAYWTKLSCFEYGARHKVRSKRSCRQCYSYADIAKFYPVPASPKALSDSRVSSR